MMTLNVYSERGIPLNQQWKSFQQIVEKPYDFYSPTRTRGPG